jgi:hypothetical protein
MRKNFQIATNQRIEILCWEKSPEVPITPNTPVIPATYEAIDVR